MTPQKSIDQINIRTQKWVLFVSVTLFLIKLAAYLLTNSISIFTDMLESIVNVTAGFVGLVSLVIAARPKDHDHPYGHGKAELISSSFEGLLIGVAGIMIIVEATRNYFSPPEIKQLDWGILLIVISGIINYITGFICVKIGKRNKSIALIASSKHLQSDSYSTAGIVIGLIFLYIFGFQWIDSLVAGVFGLVITFTSYQILRQSIAGIMDEVDNDLLNEVIPVLQNNRKEQWVDIHNLRIIKYGNVLHLDCHLTLPWYISIKKAHEELMDLEYLMKTHFGPKVEIFIHSDACQEFSCKLCSVSNCPHRLHKNSKSIFWNTKTLTQLNKHR